MVNIDLSMHKTSSEFVETAASDAARPLEDDGLVKFSVRLLSSMALCLFVFARSSSTGNTSSSLLFRSTPYLARGVWLGSLSSLSSLDSSSLAMSSSSSIFDRSTVLVVGRNARCSSRVRSSLLLYHWRRRRDDCWFHTRRWAGSLLLSVGWSRVGAVALSVSVPRFRPAVLSGTTVYKCVKYFIPKYNMRTLFWNIHIRMPCLNQELLTVRSDNSTELTKFLINIIMI